ncbi:MAG TPA: MFS transporter [Fimbriimonadaceae bacterium]|nr:MFS transporter [Fimbriimonadaceae bacterium]
MSEAERPWYRSLSAYQWTILFVAWLGWVFDVFDAAIFQFTKTPMLKQMMGEAAYADHGTAVEGWIQGIFLAGWALGGLLFGILADRWGRTRTLTVTILVYSLFTGLTVFCKEPWQVGALRFVTALGIGGEWAAGAALVAEVMPNRARAAAAAMLQSAAAFGPAIAALAQIPLKNSGWQAMYLVGLVPALVCVAIRFFVKEPESTEKAISGAKSPLAELWRNAKWRRHALIAMVIGAVVVTGAGTATFWAPNLLDAANAGLDKAAIAERKAFGILISHIGTLLGVLLVPWLCEKFGRKRTIGAFFLLTPISVIAVAKLGNDYSTLLWLLPVINFFAIGISAALALYFPELFPTRIRATGAGLAYNVGRVFAIAMPIVIGIVIGQSKSIGAGFLLSAGVYAFGIVAIVLAPETKGKPLPIEG